ncbi:unnamed protein product [Protopolystoma xenopodis]|uniref:Uncharacterized protein n=1 Tax=Protopolystoma xenopodis TaxID=117903 RepID=A0A448X202_9PLAT|nr:unnamed protein product [Protopolystoma xenopodis]
MLTSPPSFSYTVPPHLPLLRVTLACIGSSSRGKLRGCLELLTSSQTAVVGLTFRSSSPELFWTVCDPIIQRQYASISTDLADPNRHLFPCSSRQPDPECVSVGPPVLARY